MAQQQVMKPVNLSTPAAAGNQGAWSEEETEKLRKLAEESKSQGAHSANGEIDWDWVCAAWGAGRTRHQILIKATNVGMKESSTRGLKRRRETDPGPGDATAVTATPNGSTTTQAVLNAVGAAAGAAVTTSTSPDRPESTSLSAQPSPIVPHVQTTTTTPVHVPTPTPGATSLPIGGGTIMQWPMPHVAANTPSPVITSTALGARSGPFYRERGGST